MKRLHELDESEFAEICEEYAKEVEAEQAELSALRSLRDAVGKYFAEGGAFNTDIDAESKKLMKAAYQKCEATND